MRLVIYFVILIGVFVRHQMSENRTSERLQFLLLSAIVQSLIIYPKIFSELLVIKERDVDYLGAPFEIQGVILFPTLLAFFMLTLNKTKKRWNFNSVKFSLIAITISFVFSLLTPLNPSRKATVIALIVFLQIGVVVYVCKLCLNHRQVFAAIYDGLKILVIVEFIISFSYSILHIDTIQRMFLLDFDDAEWIREGTNVRRAYGTTGQPNRLGGLCALSLVYFISCWLSNYKKNLSLSFALLSFSCIVFSQSRSALVSSVISSIMLYLLMLYKENRLSYVKLIAFVITFFFLAVGLLSTSIIGDMFLHSNVDEQEDARLAHYLASWLILKKTYFLGVGLNSSVFYMYHVMNLNGIVSYWMQTHAIHSIHMTIFVELGLIGFIYWIYFLTTRLKQFVKTPFSRMNNPVLWYSFTGMLINILIHGFTDCLYFHYQYMMLVFLIGAFYSRRDSHCKIRLVQQ